MIKVREVPKMTKMTVEFPVVAWASVNIEVSKDLSLDEVRDLILSDKIEIEMSLKDIQGFQPFFSLSDIDRESLGEIPWELEIND